jgi:hypothetical protein
MITIFTNPRPFSGPFDRIQRNAILSWLALKPECEIILFEDEEKTSSRVAEELGLICIRDVRCDEFGTPLLDDVFEKVKKIAKNEIIVQVNTDIILMNDFVEAVDGVKKIMGGKPFFMSGRRHNLDFEEKINFNDKNWQNDLRKIISERGKLHRASAMDYWMFRRDFNLNPPPFIIGRPGMDSWLIFRSRQMKIPVIDATEVISIIHQNHNYPSKKKHFFDIEKKRNIELAGGLSCACTLLDANFILTKDGLGRPNILRRILSSLTLFYPWRQLLAFKRKIQNSIK